jgi:N-methylhydantoinase B/oxoprolinase/acetone carboxylase alpha subunit
MLQPDSAGLGRWRGAYSHLLEVSTLPDYPAPVSFFVDPDRLRFPPPGLAGGADGPRAEVADNGQQCSIDDLATGQITLASPEDRLVMRVPGGAGYGPPDERDPELIRQDVASGLATNPDGTPENGGDSWSGDDD